MFKKVNYMSSQWKAQYYKHFFGITSKMGLHVDKVCHHYLESLLFTMLYYTSGVPSWTFHYKYRMAPLPSDLLGYLDRNPNVMSNISFDLGTPFLPIEQLIIVLPPQKHGLIPEGYRKVATELAEYYPNSFKLDMLAGGKNIYSEPMLPMIDISKVRQLCKVC